MRFIYNSCASRVDHAHDERRLSDAHVPDDQRSAGSVRVLLDAGRLLAAGQLRYGRARCGPVSGRNRDGAGGRFPRAHAGRCGCERNGNGHEMKPAACRRRPSGGGSGSVEGHLDGFAVGDANASGADAVVVAVLCVKLREEMRMFPPEVIIIPVRFVFCMIFLFSCVLCVFFCFKLINYHLPTTQIILIIEKTRIICTLGHAGRELRICLKQKQHT